MTHIDNSPKRRSSVTLRTKTHESLISAVAKLNANGIKFSEQRVMRECVRIYLKLWRGRKSIAERNRTYNKCIGPYEIVPLYTTEALRSAAWARSHHAGISFSRMMDFAISYYLPRVLEYWLRIEYYWREKQDAAIWAAQYKLRRNTSTFVISYTGQTAMNNGTALEYEEKTKIEPWPPPNRA